MLTSARNRRAVMGDRDTQSKGYCINYSRDQVRLVESGRNPAVLRKINDPEKGSLAQWVTPGRLICFAYTVEICLRSSLQAR